MIIFDAERLLAVNQVAPRIDTEIARWENGE